LRFPKLELRGDERDEAEIENANFASVAMHATAIFKPTFCWRSINNTLGDKPFQQTNDYFDGNRNFHQAR
jgi:hypothetical protein